MPSSDPKTPATGSDYDDAHPEQDPAEGSRDVIDHDLAEAGGQTSGKTDDAASGNTSAGRSGE